jgi:hypothetical protein
MLITICITDVIVQVTRIAQSVQQRTTGWTAEARFPAGTGDSSLLHSIQTGSGAFPSSYPTGTGSCLPRVKRPSREADHSPPSNSEVKTGGAILPLHQGVVLN